MRNRQYVSRDPHPFTTGIVVMQDRIRASAEYVTARAAIIDRAVAVLLSHTTYAALKAAGGNTAITMREMAAYLAEHPELSADCGSKMFPMSVASVLTGVEDTNVCIATRMKAASLRPAVIPLA